MKRLVVLFLFFQLIGFSQEIPKDSSFIKHTFLETGGLVSYYFWEEDSLGYIINSKVDKPYLKNYQILFHDRWKTKSDVNSEQLQRIINAFAHDVSGEKERSHFEFKDSIHKEKYTVGLKRVIAEQSESVFFIRNNSSWKSSLGKKVTYFSIDKNNRLKYIKSSDSVILEKLNVKSMANGQYVVFSYLKNNDEIKEQQIFSYQGEDVTTFFKENKTMQADRFMVFINGYRGPTREKDETDHLVISKDRYRYWFKIDDRFIETLKPSKAYYLDGSMSIKTSNHRSMLNFIKSFALSTYVFRKKKARDNYKRLNTEQNLAGFERRIDYGKIGGEALLTALCNSPACQKTIDTIDIVCHSMGYAYTLGMIESLKGKVVFGKIYILAPENACQEGADWSQFEQVWQYGSNLGEKDADPLWEQDGIAPQCAVKGIETLDPTKGGRAFFPKDWKRKNFVDSHMLYNFDWIFEQITKGQVGFIGK